MAEEREQLLRDAYRAFNARDIDAAVALMHPEVDWPNAWEGGRLMGREAVAEYWRRQLEAISSTVEPRSFRAGDDGSLTATVSQVVHDATTGEVLSEGTVLHRYLFDGDLILRMDVVEADAQL